MSENPIPESDINLGSKVEEQPIRSTATEQNPPSSSAEESIGQVNNQQMPETQEENTINTNQPDKSKGNEDYVRVEEVIGKVTTKEEAYKLYAELSQNRKVNKADLQKKVGEKLINLGDLDRGMDLVMLGEQTENAKLMLEAADKIREAANTNIQATSRIEEVFDRFDKRFDFFVTDLLPTLSRELKSKIDYALLRLDEFRAKFFTTITNEVVDRITGSVDNLIRYMNNRR